MIRIFAVTTCLALGACASKVDECSIFSAIRGSSRDTAETRQQVDVHNAKGVGACKWRPS